MGGRGVPRASGASCLSLSLSLSHPSLFLPNPNPNAIHSSLQGVKRMGFSGFSLSPDARAPPGLSIWRESEGPGTSIGTRGSRRGRRALALANPASGPGLQMSISLDAGLHMSDFSDSGLLMSFCFRCRVSDVDFFQFRASNDEVWGLSSSLSFSSLDLSDTQVYES